MISRGGMAMSRAVLGALVVLVWLETSGWAQVITAGSTLEGDYLRGVGIAATGMGIFNEKTAIANRMNTETFIMWNEYIWNVAKNENKEGAEHRAAMIARHA